MGKINAKGEFLDITKNYKVIAVDISFGDNRWNANNDDDDNSFKLKPLHTKNEYDEFLEFLDRDYDNGYGGQQLFGMIYCENGVWMERGEYDGSEWWNINEYPDMRSSFDEIDVIKYERNKKLKNISNL